MTSAAETPSPLWMSAGRRSGARQRVDRFAVAKLHEMLIALAPDGELEPGRQRVDDRHADAVQPARDLVGIGGTAELAAGVELGHDDLGRRDALFVQLRRDAATVVAHRAGAVGIKCHQDLCGMAGQRFVDRIVDDFVDHVVKARAIVGIADIHAGALAHGIEASEHFDVVGTVVGGVQLRGRQLRGVQFSRVQLRGVQVGLLAGGFNHWELSKWGVKCTRFVGIDVTRNERAVQDKMVLLRYCYIYIFQGFER